MRIELFETIQATFSNGRAKGRKSPGAAGSSWQIKRMRTTIPVAASTPVKCKVYRNVESEANQLDSSDFSGASDTSETDIPVPSHDSILVVWSADTSNVPDGTVATLILQGFKETGR